MGLTAHQSWEILKRVLWRLHYLCMVNSSHRCPVVRLHLCLVYSGACHTCGQGPTSCVLYAMKVGCMWSDLDHKASGLHRTIWPSLPSASNLDSILITARETIIGHHSSVMGGFRCPTVNGTMKTWIAEGLFCITKWKCMCICKSKSGRLAGFTQHVRLE